MLSPSAHTELLARLRAEVAPAATAVCGGALPFGLSAIDGRLADGGLSASALHEIASASADLAVDAATMLFTAGIAARFANGQRSVVWAVSRLDLYAPGLEQAGLSPDRLLCVEAADDAQVLAVMEDALRHGALAAVIGEARRASMTSTRRLQLAASEGRTPALLVRRWRRSDACPLSEPSAAATRWRIACSPSPAPELPGLDRPRWQIELVRQRNGDPFTLTVEACDATGRLALPAATADRAAATGGAITHAA